MTNEATSALGRGVMCLSNGKYDLAIEKCNEAIRLHRGHAAAFYMRAVAYRAKGNYARATADFEQAMRLVPPGAIGDLKEAIRWDLGDATAFYNRGNAYHNERDARPRHQQLLRGDQARSAACRGFPRPRCRVAGERPKQPARHEV